MEIVNQIRGYRFLLGILRHQQTDPCCGRCSAYANTLKAVLERLALFEAEEAGAIGVLPTDLREMLAEARDGLLAIQAPDQPSGQKKAGNCKLPQGVCFIKASFALFQQA